MSERMAVQCTAQEEPLYLVRDWVINVRVILKCNRLRRIISPRLSHDNSLYIDIS